jgi:hypothetical protein
VFALRNIDPLKEAVNQKMTACDTGMCAVKPPVETLVFMLTAKDTVRFHNDMKFHAKHHTLLAVKSVLFSHHIDVI